MPETAGNESSIAIGKLFQIQGSEPTNTKGPVEERAFTLMVSNDGERPFPPLRAVAAQCSYRCQLDFPWAAKKLIGKQQITQKQKAQSFDWAFCFI
ncbi:hypothetical protein LNO89_19340 [Klebsiella pneumoniae subsp. pneumoniae]|nr:hypothetical protein [Klebsiella pneumoniae subsp. pneumoniae]